MDEGGQPDSTLATTTTTAAAAAATTTLISTEEAVSATALLASEVDPMADEGGGGGGSGGGGGGDEDALLRSAPRAPLPPALPLPASIHVRTWRYLPASSEDLKAYFHPLRPTRIVWLNALSVNVLFEDDATAARVLELFGEGVPTVSGIPPVHPSWRTCLKPLVKPRTDKYGVEGSETTIWIRRTTTHDTKENAAPTHGECVCVCAMCAPFSF